MYTWRSGWSGESESEMHVWLLHVHFSIWTHVHVHMYHIVSVNHCSLYTIHVRVWFRFHIFWNGFETCGGVCRMWHVIDGRCTSTAQLSILLNQGLCVWVYGCMDVWVYGCMGIHVHNNQCAWVPAYVLYYICKCMTVGVVCHMTHQPHSYPHHMIRVVFLELHPNLVIIL